MDNVGDGGEGNSSRSGIRTSFFTRKFSYKLRQKGKSVPPEIMLFLDTPICNFDEEQRTYFEEKFNPMMHSVISILSEVYEEVAADRDGWGDMIGYDGKKDTPIKICARAVLESKEREARGANPFGTAQEQEAREMRLPS